MQKRLTRYFSERYLPKWIVFWADTLIVAFSFLLAYSLRHNFLLDPTMLRDMLHQIPLLLVAYWIGFIIFKTYSGVIRFTVTQDIFLIFFSAMTGATLFFLFNITLSFIESDKIRVISQSILIIDTVVTVYLLTISRLGVKFIYNVLQKHNRYAVNVMIYGAGDLGSATLMVLQKSKNPEYNIVGFIDRNQQLHGLKKNGIEIYSPETAFTFILPDKKVREVIIAIAGNKINNKENEILVDASIKHNVVVKKVPPVQNWMNGSFALSQARPIDIADLLGRDEIFLDCDKIQQSLNEKTILVTGAAGSIGSEIIRQLIAFRPGKLILVDQAESALYNLQMELVRKYNGSRNYEVVIADVTNFQRMDSIFRKYHPQIVFNAAAYKHVPLLEDNVCEALRVNIGGTKLLADLSIKHGVEKFVMISTDKAVNPTNVMGASKRICEMYVQSLTAINGIMTNFITTRFGNVLGSNGSVVPLFTKQIEEGGPVTVTHKDIQRYFMTIPEACQLVLEAGFMGKGGEIFVFDMGSPVKIYDLAVKMITLAGLEPGKDIKIVETGLRPGEKLYEELLASKELTRPTHHPKILIANSRKLDPVFVKHKIEEIIAFSMKEKETELVKRIKFLVPEFIPMNPKYEEILNSIVQENDEIQILDKMIQRNDSYRNKIVASAGR
jgi:FlaA1/EpsC-like NDP-sugar epimerase